MSRSGPAIEELLLRTGLSPSTRLLVIASVAAWRGDQDRLGECARCARELGQPRQDFEEALLQTVLFAGFPRAVTAFETLNRVWPADPAPTGGGLPRSEQLAAGNALFAAIYGHNDAAVHAMLRGFHAEFHDFVLEAAYGRILARPGLPPLVRETMAIAVLAAQDQARQFVAHARGAAHFGASKAELREALVSIFAHEPDVDRWMQLLR